MDKKPQQHLQILMVVQQPLEKDTEVPLLPSVHKKDLQVATEAPPRAKAKVLPLPKQLHATMKHLRNHQLHKLNARKPASSLILMIVRNSIVAWIGTEIRERDSLYIILIVQMELFLTPA